MDLTHSYEEALPADVLAKYKFRETRNAAAVLAGTNPRAFEDLVRALRDFTLLTADLVAAGGNESNLAARLNASFRAHGWRESRADVETQLKLYRFPYGAAGEKGTELVSSTTIAAEGYKVDNVIERVALDVEWNAKDGNLDRDLGAYRSWYDLALIDVAVIITRMHDELRDLAYRLARDAGQSEEAARKRLNTSTTTNFNKLVPRLQRGDGGGCPVLAVFISEATWHGDTP
ncbi:BglII/BstYI family type II restriction endonuclease [Isoptericola dokdonensis]|uniref:Restriction endonuclease BglII n=1 Tax=Isoptericola dokdonensis DS-3 TaxID=1300344 RepID=A0A168FDN3_9MICO|nr:BglII/BstYI family type II restriction endonuclease [Isoptericola dokdonensis]ANC31456.1 Restriction endonuclease BglII [Isoptericola dokdonensis DS-3]